MEIKFEQLQNMLPRCDDVIQWTVLLNTYLPKFGVDTPEEIARFIAQCGHESNDFSVRSENLNYSTQGLLKTFRKYFDESTAPAYARRPEKIANRVYANRMSNGNEASGDGWKFRGRGIIQLTGKANYRTCSEDLFQDERLLANPETVAEPNMALQSALWFWNKNKLNAISDMVLLTRRINGGQHGLADRQSRYSHSIKILKG
jgi:putative chitinase